MFARYCFYVFHFCLATATSLSQIFWATMFAKRFTEGWANQLAQIGLFCGPKPLVWVHCPQRCYFLSGRCTVQVMQSKITRWVALWRLKNRANQTSEQASDCFVDCHSASTHTTKFWMYEFCIYQIFSRNAQFPKVSGPCQCLHLETTLILRDLPWHQIWHTTQIDHSCGSPGTCKTKDPWHALGGMVQSVSQMSWSAQDSPILKGFRFRASQSGAQPRILAPIVPRCPPLASFKVERAHFAA